MDKRRNPPINWFLFPFCNLCVCADSPTWNHMIAYLFTNHMINAGKLNLKKQKTHNYQTIVNAHTKIYTQSIPLVDRLLRYRKIDSFKVKDNFVSIWFNLPKRKNPFIFFKKKKKLSERGKSLQKFQIMLKKNNPISNRSNTIESLELLDHKIFIRKLDNFFFGANIVLSNWSEKLNYQTITKYYIRSVRSDFDHHLIQSEAI